MKKRYIIPADGDCHYCDFYDDLSFGLVANNKRCSLFDLSTEKENEHGEWFNGTQCERCKDAQNKNQGGKPCK